MAFFLLYNGQDSEKIAASYLSARNSLANADRLNIERCWDSGLDTYNTAPLVFLGGDESDPSNWDPVCLQQPAGTIDTGLCDTLTRKISVAGNWARNAPSGTYGAQINQPIQIGVVNPDGATGTQFVGLMLRLASIDPDLVRAEDIRGLAQDIAATAVDVP
jgi:hypothetical protein